MARMSRLVGAACLGAAFTAAFAATVATQEWSPVHRSHPEVASWTSGRVIVKFKDRTSTLASTLSLRHSGPQAAGVMAARHGLALTDGRVLGARTQVLRAVGIDSATLATTLATDPDVEWVEVDHRRTIQQLASTPDDPLYADNQVATTPVAGQWYLRAPDSTIVSAINAPAAWAITHGSSSVVIADVDTGITAHPDLSSKLFAATFPGTTASTPYGYDFVGYGSGDSAGGTNPVAVANDGNTADPDPSDPGDWVSSSDVSSGNLGSGCTSADVENSSWHGTQTAGILAAATDNATGMAGVGWDTMIVPVRALGKCGGFDSDIIAAAEWAGGVLADSAVPTNTHPAKVINMSLGGSGSCGPAYQDALTRLRDAGVLVVAAAGNDEGLAVDAPANCQPATTDANQTPIVVAVAALRHSGDKVGFSDVGSEVQISAPGGNCVNTSSSDPCLYPILTTSNTGTTVPASPTYTTSFGTPSLGTSFATPLVAGTLALMASANSSLTNGQLISLMKSTATPFPTSGGTAGTPACHAPTTAAQDECYCTTSTCGAGMLNAGAAVAAATTATAGSAMIAGASTVATGQSITLSASGSTPFTGATVDAWRWTVLSSSGGGAVTLSGASSPTVTVTGSSAGTVTLQLATTDSSFTQATATTTVTVTGSSSSGGGSSGGGSTSSGGGGGAANPARLVALAVAGLLLTPRRRARR